MKCCEFSNRKREIEQMKFVKSGVFCMLSSYRLADLWPASCKALGAIGLGLDLQNIFFSGCWHKRCIKQALVSLGLILCMLVVFCNCCLDFCVVLWLQLYLVD